MSDEPYKVPKDHKLEIVEDEVRGGSRHVHLRVRRPDGGIEREWVVVRALPKWD